MRKIHPEFEIILFLFIYPRSLSAGFFRFEHQRECPFRLRKIDPYIEIESTYRINLIIDRIKPLQKGRERREEKEIEE